MGHFFVANGNTDADKKGAVPITAMWATAYKLLHSLVSPAKPGEKPYRELVAAMSKHFSPKPSEIVQRYKFHTRFRQAEETVATYVVELRTLAEFCNFGADLEDMLRDRLVCGIQNDMIQWWLLSESKLTYEKAIKLAQASETAMKNVKELNGRPAANRSRRCAQGPRPRETGGGDAPCYRCGRTGHMPSRCRFKEAKCYKCGRVGHTRSVCRSKTKSPPPKS